MSTRNALLALVLAVAAACTSVYRTLPPQDEVKDLARLAETTAALPNHKDFVTVGEIDGRPIRLAFRHTRRVESDRLVVMLHGVMSDSGTWRFMAGDLGVDHNLLLLDLMGCGNSDKPDPNDLPPDGYSPTALARQVATAIRLRSKDERIVLVGHSLGGMVILRLLGSQRLRVEFADVVDRVDRAILLSSVDFAVERAHPTFEKIAGLTDLQVTLGNALGILREEVARSVRDGAGDPDRMPREEADRLIAVFRDPARRRAAQAMLRQAVPYTPEGRPDWTRIERLVKDYRNIDAPCLIVWGARDETFGAQMGYKLYTQIPDAWLRVLPGCMHALPAEAPHACSAHVRQFIATGGNGSPRVLDGVIRVP